MFREARIDDAPGIAETHVASWQATYRGLIPDDYLDGLSVPMRTERWRERFQSENGATFIFEEGGQISAFADFGRCRDKDKDPDKTCELYAIYIRPEAQGRGLGRNLFERGLAWAKDNGFKEMTTLVLKGNDPAHKFYLAMGLKEDGMEIPATIGGRDVVEIRLSRSV